MKGYLSSSHSLADLTLCEGLFLGFVILLQLIHSIHLHFYHNLIFNTYLYGGGVYAMACLEVRRQHDRTWLSLLCGIQNQTEATLLGVNQTYPLSHPASPYHNISILYFYRVIQFSFSRTFWLINVS